MPVQRILFSLVGMMLAASAQAGTVENPQFGTLSTVQTKNLTNDTVIQSIGFAERLNATIIFKNDLLANFIGYFGDGAFGKDASHRLFNGYYFAKGTMIPSTPLSASGPNEMNDDIASIIPESIHRDNSSFVSASEMLYPFTPYCHFTFQGHGEDYPDNTVTIVKAGQPMNFDMLGGSRYKDHDTGDWITQFWGFAQPDKGAPIELNCYAPANGPLNLTQATQLLQTIFGGNATVTMRK